MPRPTPLVNPDDFAPYRRVSGGRTCMVAGRKQFFPQRRAGNDHATASRTPTRGSTTSCAVTWARRARPQRAGPCRDGADLRALWPMALRAAEQARAATLRRPSTGRRQPRGLMRVLLFKRFESSVYAFRETVGRLLRIHRLFWLALDSGHRPGRRRGSIAALRIRRRRRAGAARRARGGQRPLRRWRISTCEAAGAHRAGHRMLGEMLAPGRADHAGARRQAPGADQAACRRPELRAGKRLIFTQYADTAQYLYDEL